MDSLAVVISPRNVSEKTTKKVLRARAFQKMYMVKCPRLDDGECLLGVFESDEEECGHTLTCLSKNGNAM